MITHKEVLRATTSQRKLVADYRAIENGNGPSSKIGQWMLGGRKRTTLPDSYKDATAFVAKPQTVPFPFPYIPELDLSDRVFGELTVVGFFKSFWDGQSHRTKWVVQCVCGKYEIRKGSRLLEAHKRGQRCIECQAEHWLHEQDCYAITGFFPEEWWEQEGKAWTYTIDGRTYIRDDDPSRVI